MRNFAHVTELVLDRIAFDDSDEEVAEAIEEFLMMYQVRITLIYEGLKQEKVEVRQVSFGELQEEEEKQILQEKGVKSQSQDKKVENKREEQLGNKKRKNLKQVNWGGGQNDIIYNYQCNSV
ncbi:MAG TPA: hypothetical protein IAC14_10965 [Candidatus Scybalomonas excrementigallinarum]|nr:hypothetical protein [Candidatus Scybalomonas excrementigallinarum]